MHQLSKMFNHLAFLGVLFVQADHQDQKVQGHHDHLFRLGNRVILEVQDDLLGLEDLQIYTEHNIIMFPIKQILYCCSNMMT